MRKQSPKFTRLALALQIAIAVPATATAQQLVVTDGTTQTASGTYNTGTTANAPTLVAIGDGSTITGSGVSATTAGTSADAVLADQKGRIELVDSTLKTTGNEAYGALADDFGVVKLTNTQIVTTGATDAHGAVAFAGGQMELAGGSVATQKGSGVAASGPGSVLTAQGTKVTVAGAVEGSHGATAQDGGVIRLGPGTSVEVDPAADGNGHGLLALGAGSQVYASGATITTGAGTGATNHNHGAVAAGGGLIDLRDNTSVTTRRYQGYGLAATGSGSTVQGSNVAVTSLGESGRLLRVDTGGKINLSNAELTSTGASTISVAATGAGSAIELDQFKLKTTNTVAVAEDGASIVMRNGTADASASHALGYLARGKGSRIQADAVDVTLTPAESFTVLRYGDGAQALDGGQIALGSGSSIVLKGDSRNDRLLYASGEGSTIDVVGTTLEAGISGAVLAPYGAVASEGGRINFSGGSSLEMKATADTLLATGKDSLITARDTRFLMKQYTGTASVKVYDGARMELGPGTVLTETATGDLGYVVRVDGEGSFLSALGTTLDSQQSPLNAIAVGNKAQAHLGENTKVISNALGLTVGASAKATLDKASIKTTREQGALVYGALDMTDASIETTDEANHAALQLSTYYADEASPITVNISGGSLTSAGGAAIRSYASELSPVDAGAVVRLSKGVQLSGKDRLLAHVVDEGSLKLIADDVDLEGNLMADRSRSYRPILDVELINTSTLNGVVKDATNLSIDPTSRWSLTGSSNVVNSLVSAGTIAFAAPASSDFKTLTVGNYTGNGGTLAINTVLGDDASATDKLIVTGSTSGNTQVTVNNVAGAGAATAHGIQVVQVGGASDGVFALNGRAVAGAHEYQLLKGGVDDPSDGDWYLRSQAVPAPDPVPTPVPDPTPVPAPVPDPAPVHDPVAPVPAPLYRPETAAYLANQAAAVGMFRHSMHDRMGEPNFAADDRPAAGWVRVVRSQMDGQAGFDQLDVSTDTSLLQMGGELGMWRGDNRVHLGAMGGTGSAHSHAGSSLTSYRAKGKVTGYNLGVYGTWFANADDVSGLYVDTWLQYGRYTQKVLGDYLAPEKYDARTASASVEAGYAFALNPGGRVGYFIEPQVQVIYTDYDMQAHTEANGTQVDDDRAGGLTSRLGVRFYGHSALASANTVQPFATLNWWRDSGYNRIAFNDVAEELRLPRDRYELKVGIQAQLGGGWTGWGQLGALAGDDDYRDLNGQLGLNYRW